MMKRNRERERKKKRKVLKSRAKEVNGVTRKEGKLQAYDRIS